MKKYLLLFISIIAILSCSNRENIESKNIVIGAIMGNMADTFIKYIHDDLLEYSKSKENITILIKDASGDAGIEQNLVENLILQGVDGIMLQLVNPETSRAIDDLAKQSNIPILYFNHRPKGLEEGTYSYVGLNERRVGELQAEAALKVKNSGNAVILIGPLGTEAAEDRTKGVKDKIVNSGIKILREQSAAWYRDRALTIVENWITSGLNIDFVFSNNDDMAIGAIQGLEASGKVIGTNKGEIMVFGVDATPDGMSLINDGKMYATIKQDTMVQASEALDAMIDLINNGTNIVKYLDAEVIISSKYK
ncbi:substrate-binding domain-containing protein [Brachyspira aalborgi]|uniref:Periplasmic binding protein domain-containing protein n=1 Tax=Brachyspira aalborgi TaxID=29522 RepID=A0A5C8ELG9_9SPIR|nr:substrate-binding domain-containing protein [Brachyspira aalborgi]TXJ38218.1 hypothetical protein EPJ78_05840 [Brachyspira aalborgi]